jgi:hypothetical protein
VSGLKGSVKKTRARHDPALEGVKLAAGSEDRTQVNVYLPKTMQRDLKVQAALEDRSMSALVEIALKRYLEENKAKA